MRKHRYLALLSYIILCSKTITNSLSINHENIENKVIKSGRDFIFTVSSEKYGLNLKVYLKEESDPFIFDPNSDSKFVVLNEKKSAKVNKASGSIKGNRFIGQFQVGNMTYFVDTNPDTDKGLAHHAILYSLEDAFALDATTLGSDVKQKYLEAKDDPSAPQALSNRPKTKGNVCQMRIIIDHHLMKVFNDDEDKLRTTIKQHELKLNEIYQSIKIRGKSFKFKVVDVIFREGSYCRSEPNDVACKSWRSSEDDEFLEEHARTDHSDVCLTFLWTSQDFGATLGVAYIGTVCNTHKRTINSAGNIEYLSANTGFITFGGRSHVPTSYLTFAHEVGHNMGSGHDGQGKSQGCGSKGNLMAAYAPYKPTEQNHQFSDCSRMAIESAVRDLEKDGNRQCLVTEKQVKKPPKKQPNPTKKPTVVRIDTNNPIEDDLPKTLLSSSAIYILSALVVILVITIALLLFCLCAKRDMSPCPKKSDFGRRFTEVRRNVRQSVRNVRSRTMTEGLWRSRSPGSTNILEDEDPLSSRGSQSPSLASKLKEGTRIQNFDNRSPILKNKAYVTPTSQMIPKAKPRFAAPLPNTARDAAAQPKFQPLSPLKTKKTASPVLMHKTPDFNVRAKTPERPSPDRPRQVSPFVRPKGSPVAGSPYTPARPVSPLVHGENNSSQTRPLFASKKPNVTPLQGGGSNNFNPTGLSQPKSPGTIFKQKPQPRFETSEMGREESESLLGGEIIGGFIVRTSKGKKVLSVKVLNKIKHIQLIEENGLVSGDHKTWFDTSDDLVQFYKENTIPGSPNLRLR